MESPTSKVPGKEAPPAAAPGAVHVLVVEDNPADAHLVERLLSKARGAVDVCEGLFDVACVDRLAAALELLEREAYDVLLLDLGLPDAQGVETLSAVRAVAAMLPVVVLTGCDDDGLALRAIQHGAQDYLAKDHLDSRLLGRTLRHAIERKRAEVQVLRHARQVEAAHARIEQQARELRSRADELDRINRELDDFAYIASHDLKEPLRGIRAYCEILLEDCHERLDQSGQRRLGKLVDLCSRLEKLIGDLLTYCRLGGARPARQRVDLALVVDEVLETLGPSLDRRAAEVRVAGRLPEVVGDPTLVGMALANLISNGLKFNDSPRPTVEIGASEGKPPILYVRDNGIGIAPEHHDVIFTIFRRLHARDRYEGSGAGLTIVRKIVEAHGGRIWLESQPGAGSTFFLTLAAAGEKAPAGPPAPHFGERAPLETPQHGRRATDEP